MLAQPNSLLTHLSGLDGKLEPLYSAPSTKQGRAPGSITAGSDGGSLLQSIPDPVLPPSKEGAGSL